MLISAGFGAIVIAGMLGLLVEQGQGRFEHGQPMEDSVTQAPNEAPNTAGEVHVYAGTGGHSAWFSDDRGVTWVHPNSHSGMYLEARVWSLVSHPGTPERLFAGSDMGIFRWDEPTARWTHLPSPMQDVWARLQREAQATVLGVPRRPRSTTPADSVFSGVLNPGYPCSHCNLMIFSCACRTSGPGVS